MQHPPERLRTHLRAALICPISAENFSCCSRVGRKKNLEIQFGFHSDCSSTAAKQLKGHQSASVLMLAKAFWLSLTEIMAALCAASHSQRSCLPRECSRPQWSGLLVLGRADCRRSPSCSTLGTAAAQSAVIKGWCQPLGSKGISPGQTRSQGVGQASPGVDTYQRTLSLSAVSSSDTTCPRRA